jgi:hypothetical protein
MQKLADVPEDHAKAKNFIAHTYRNGHAPYSRIKEGRSVLFFQSDNNFLPLPLISVQS